MLSVLRQRTLCHTPIATAARRVAGCSLSYVTTQATKRPATPIISKAYRSLRSQSTAAAGKKQDEVFKYPEWLNVYRLSSAATLWVGLSRVCTLVVFGVGAFVYAPSFYFSPDHSNWMIPVFIIGSAVPMIAITLATGPSVHAIRVKLPTHARRSREGLLKLANNVPPQTRIRIESMKLIPWPTKRHAWFEDLVRHRPSWKGGLSNLEDLPLANQGHPDEGTFWHWIARRFMGRYYVQRDQKKDRSSAPGVWDKIWDQIPEADSPPGKTQQRKRVASSGGPRTELKPLPPAHRPKPKAKP